MGSTGCETSPNNRVLSILQSLLLRPACLSAGNALLTRSLGFRTASATNSIKKARTLLLHTFFLFCFFFIRLDASYSAPPPLLSALRVSSNRFCSRKAAVVYVVTNYRSKWAGRKGGGSDYGVMSATDESTPQKHTCLNSKNSLESRVMVDEAAAAASASTFG